MSSLLERLKKNSTIKEASVLANSKFFNDMEMVPTKIPAINIALSGSLDGGISAGLHTLAGPSRHFKTSFALVMVKAYLDKYPDAIVAWYDSEFGSPQSYFANYGIDLNRVWHIPIMDMEEFKFDIINQFEQFTKEDRIIVVLDSYGNLASKKEKIDSIDQKSTTDMTRARVGKGIFRMITPYLQKKDIPMLAIAHTYQTQEIYSKAVVSGGTGIMYASNSVWIIGRSQEKDGSDLIGYSFNINIEKSRFVREKSKIPITVTFEGGVDEWSGLLEIALELGSCVKPSNGWYQRVNLDTGEVEEKKFRAKDTNSKEFWTPILNSPKFKEAVEQRYKISNGTMLDDEIDDELESIDIDDIDMED